MNLTKMNPKLDKYIKRAFRCDPRSEEQKAWMKYGFQLGRMAGIGQEITLDKYYYKEALHLRWKARKWKPFFNTKNNNENVPIKPNL